jgi:hypothetical protein
MKRIISLVMIFLIIFMLPSQIYALEAKGAIKEKSQVQNICTGGVNVKDSFILSVVTLCLPGILEKIEEKRQIECQAVVCRYESVKFGLDPAYCIDQQAYLTCSVIVGEIFALPPLAMIDYYREGVANVLANPIGVAYGIAVTAARKSVSGSCAASGGFLCDVSSNIPLQVAVPLLTVTDALSVVNTLTGLLENGFESLDDKGYVDYCEQLPDIKAEMEEILASNTGDVFIAQGPETGVSSSSGIAGSSQNNLRFTSDDQE